MRTLPRLAASTIAITVALLLGGCVEPQPNGTPTPNPGATPIFESEEAALAAAEAAYAEYVRVADQIFMDGGADAERLREVATGEQLEVDLAGFTEIAELGLTSTGGTRFEKTELQQMSGDSGPAVVVVYLCEDISRVDVTDSTGASVVSAERPNRVQYEVTFDTDSQAADRLLVSLKEPWGGSAAC